jgi:hypothetical protein
LALLGLALAVGVSRALPGAPRAAFDPSLRTRLERIRPQFLLLGNSMVDTRFDEPTLRRLLPGKRVAVVGIPGSKSAVWYLALKNAVVPSGARPRVLLFFRGNELTDPRARALGDEHRKLEKMAPEDDPLVEQKLAPPMREPIARLGWYRERVAPFGRLHGRSQPWVDGVSFAVSSFLWRDADLDARKDSINELFDMKHLREARESDLAEEDARVPPFRQVVAGSLLPDICDLAEKHGLPLTFIRVRTRVVAEGGADAPGEKQHLIELESYVRARGAEYEDMHDATWESVDMYGNGDHMAGRSKRTYMRLFVKHMGHVFH